MEYMYQEYIRNNFVNVSDIQAEIDVAVFNGWQIHSMFFCQGEHAYEDKTAVLYQRAAQRPAVK